MADLDKLRGMLKAEPDYTPNFGSTYSVTLPHPISVVFDKLGKGETLEASVRLSDLCEHFESLESDHVALPGSSPEILSSTCRTLSPVPSSTTNALPRQYFLLVEGVPLLFGAYTRKIRIFGCLTSDEAKGEALYESVTDGVRVHKTRKFVRVSEGETRVDEVIMGQCSRWLQMIVDKETKRGHKCVFSAILQYDRSATLPSLG